MLSLIENGSASPSVSTLLHLSKKLDIPAGYLLSDSENDKENDYIKMHLIGSVRTAFKGGNYRECIDLCESIISESDDEINLILSESYLKTAVSFYENGLFTSAAANVDKSKKAASQTAYNTTDTERDCDTILHLIKDIEADTTSPPPPRAETDLEKTAVYLKCAHLLSQDKISEASALAESTLPTSLRDHISIKVLIKNDDHATALPLLQSLITTHAALPPYILFKIYSDIETCCKVTSDFKTAYEYSTKKLEIISRTKR